MIFTASKSFPEFNFLNINHIDFCSVNVDIAE